MNPFILIQQEMEDEARNEISGEEQKPCFYLDDNNGFLHNIVDFCLNQVQQGAHTALCRLLQRKKKDLTNPPVNGF